MRIFNRHLGAGGIVYALVITFMAILVFSFLYPTFKLILIQSVMGMGDLEATMILFIPFALILAVLWGITYIIHPKQQ